MVTVLAIFFKQPSPCLLDRRKKARLLRGMSRSHGGQPQTPVRGKWVKTQGVKKVLARRKPPKLTRSYWVILSRLAERKFAGS